MSRVAKQPIEVPKGVEITIAPDPATLDDIVGAFTQLLSPRTLVAIGAPGLISGGREFEGGSSLMQRIMLPRLESFTPSESTVRRHAR